MHVLSTFCMTMANWNMITIGGSKISGVGLVGWDLMAFLAQLTLVP